MLKVTAFIIRKKNRDIIDDRKNDEKQMGCETCEFLCHETNKGVFGTSNWYSCSICDPDFYEGHYMPVDHSCKYYTPNKNYRQYLKRKKKRDRKKFNMVIESWRK